MSKTKMRWAGGLVALVALLSLSLVMGGLAIAQDDEALPPQVVDTIPLPGEELALNGTVTFYFDQDMNAESVEAAFSVVPNVPGDLSWPSPSTLIFTPTADYERATEYLFGIAATAESAAGVTLVEAYELKLRTVGYLEVSEVLPAPDSEAVDTDAIITVIFNRPVVPLVAVEDMDTLPKPLKLDPPVEGVGEWLNTSIYMFTPDKGLRGGTTYTLTVKADLEDVTGGILEKDYVWSFSTLQPDVYDIYPYDESDSVVLETPITVLFTQEMDPDSLENGGFTLYYLGEYSGAGKQGAPVSVPGKFEWDDSVTELTFQPDEMLELGSTYQVVLDAEKTLSATGAHLREGAQSTFTTVPYPAIIGTEPVDGETHASPYGGFTIYFNTPMDLDSLEDKVIVEPKPWRDYDTYFYDWRYSYNLEFDTEPTTEYTVTILPGMKDRYGNEITEGLTVTYITDEYPPELTIQGTGSVGMYSSHKPATRVFVTHRNVSRIDLSLHRVSLRQLAELTGPNSWDAWNNYTPRPNDLLRKWSLDISSQQDQRRYELLYIADKGPSGIANLQCLGAPDPQVKVGDVVIVTKEDDRPLNIRQEPNLDAQVVTQVLVDETMQITAGPFCEGGYLWWQVRLNNEIVGWAAEGDLENYYFEPLGKVPTDPNAPDPDAPGQPYTPDPLAPGIYLLTTTSPETEAYDYEPRSHIMLVQSVNVTLKFSQDSALAWVNDMESGDPAAGMEVIFYNAGFNPVARGTTDENGLAVVSIPHLVDLYTTMYAVVDVEAATAGREFGYAASQFSSGMDPWQFDINMDYQPENFTAYIYTDRPIYRPGQPVYFKGILRDRRDVTYSVPDVETVPVTVYDDRGEIIFDENVPVTPEGSFSGEVKLDPEAPLGYYRIVANVGSNLRDSFGQGFSVAEYRAPEFQVDVIPAVDQVAQGDTIQVAVEARYFFGGSVSNATVRYSVLAQDYYFNYTGDQPGWWSFRDENYDFYAPEYYGPYGEVVDEGEAKTDAMGRFLIELDADLGEKVESQTYTIEASVIDESDQLVAGRAQVIVHQGLVYIGLQPEEYVGYAERENKINILAVDWDSAPIADQDVDYEIVNREWFSVQEEDEYGRTVWTWEVKETPLEGGSGQVVTDENGLAQITFVPAVGGVYKVYATTTDANGNEIKSSAFMWVSGSNFINWRQENDNRIQLITDKDEYEVGDTAEILIPSPWQGQAWALVTVERGDILTSEVIKLESNSTVYTLPITGDFAPNIFVSVMLVKGVDENNPDAAFRMGMAELLVDTSQLVMDLEVTPSIDVAGGEFAGPGDTVSYTVKATDYQGTPVPGAEIGVGLTDLAVLSIAPSNSPDLLPFFYSERGVTVRTASPLSISVDQATQIIIDTIKGGGGGYGEGGVFDVRQEFVDTPLWSPNLVTDENGEVTFDVTLPDNLTTWRLDARAVTTGADGPMLVGQTTFDMLSTKPVLIRPGTPRFFIVGDKATMAAIVNNNTNEDLVAEVVLEGTGFMFAEGVEGIQHVTIPAKGRARVNWELEVLDVKEIDATFYVNANDGAYTDASKPPVSQGKPLPVYKYEVPETVGTAGTVYGPEAGSRTEAVVLPHRFNVTQGELTVRLDRSLAAATIDGLDWLKNYPYYCIEQVISAFLPNAITLRALESLGVDDPALKANLEVQVGYALQRLYSEQKVDGGWGWFAWDVSNPIVTAYALIGLVEAQQSGFTVNQDVINRAATFVEESLRTIRPQDERWTINRQAFLLYALARADRGNFARSVRLFAEKENMSLYAKAYLAMTFHILDPDDKRAMELINDLNNSMVVSATGAHLEEDYIDYWNWNTDTHTTALGLMAMAQIDPENQMIPNVVRWLMVARTADHWETTQETAWAVMALTEWMVITGELHPDYTFAVSLNGERRELADNTATDDNVKETEVLLIDVAEMLAEGANRLVISRTEGQGNLYYTAHLRAFLPVPEVKALDRGIIVSRKYSLLSDPDGNPITSADVGAAVQVSVTIIAPSNLHYVVVEDPIPAGADAVNPYLTTAPQVGTQVSLSRERPLSRGWGWWWFSNVEMRDEKVVLYATYLPRGTYQFNYVIYPGLAGEYNVIPTTAQEFYFPEVYGRTDGMLFTITGGAPSDAMVPAEEPAEEPTPAATEEATPEATEEATAEATPVALTQTFAAATGVSVSYPAGWVGRETDAGEIELANSSAALAVSDDPDGQMQPGQVGFVVLGALPVASLGLGDNPALTDVMTAVAGSLESGGTTDVGDVTEITLGEKPAARVNMTSSANNGEGFLVGFVTEDHVLLLIAAITAQGELAANEALLLDMAASVSYTAPAE